MVFGINTTYVDRGDEYENEEPRRDQYRRLKQKLERMQKEVLNDDQQNDSDGEVSNKKPRKKQKLPEEQEIVRGRAGIIMPARNAFDFVDKPSALELMGSGSGQ